jgi:adenine-specific DNA-methyltransferase
VSIDSIKHSKDKRVLIPSSEEAGSEAESPAVRDGKDAAEFPKNPVVTRGQDPELFWMDKYGADDKDDLLNIDIRSLYRHEHIVPEKLINRLYRAEKSRRDQLDLAAMFGNAMEMDELDKIEGYYSHADGWSNRLIQGDSLLVMTSLLEREGMAGKVQCIYIDPPYGIKYGSNWQIHLHNRNVKDGADEDLCGEPEQIKAYRDTWELGIHSYLSYLRDRLLVARDLLTEPGSCFVQISDENVHLVRCLMDEVFGSENFVSLVAFAKTTGFAGTFLSSVADYIVWYAKDRSHVKSRTLYRDKQPGDEGASKYRPVSTISAIPAEKFAPTRLATSDQLTSQGASANSEQRFEFGGRAWLPPSGLHWKTTVSGLARLAAAGRLIVEGNSLRYIRFLDDFPVFPISSLWTDIGGIQSRTDGKVYVVQTAALAIQRCILMATDPGDLVLDPTCGSGTTAYVAEQWGRRWITIDTSRIALNIAKTRLMTATLPYYKLHDERGLDIRQGFVYKKVPHVTLKSLANDEPAEEETLYDQPEIERKRLRVAGPFTVETLQSFDPISPEALDADSPELGELEQFEERIFEHLKSAGIKTGVKEECAVFTRIQRLNGSELHAEGFYQSAAGERKAYLYIGPKFGTISRLAVNDAIKACRAKGDADWLIILGFSFESNISTQEVTTSMGSFMVTKNRMHDDLMQDGLLKKDKKAASFVTIGEPDIHLERKGKTATVEIRGLDIYDPIKDEVKPRDVADISYWMVDDDYDGSNFVVRQVFFCGGDKDEFDKWKRGLSSLAVSNAKRDLEKTLKIEIDEDAFSRLYGHISHPIELKKDGPHKIAVRIISQFGEESTKVITVTS